MPLFWYSLQNLGMGNFVNVALVGQLIRQQRSGRSTLRFTRDGAVAKGTAIPIQPTPTPISIPGAVIPAGTTPRTTPQVRKQRSQRTITQAQPTPQLMQTIPPLPETPVSQSRGTPTSRGNRTGRVRFKTANGAVVAAVTQT